MVKDLLADFHRKANISYSEHNEEKISSANEVHVDVTTPLISPSNEHDDDVTIEILLIDADLDPFFHHVAGVHALIGDLKSHVDRAQSLQKEILSTPSPKEKEKSELDSLTTIFKIKSRTIRNKLKEMKKSNVKFEEMPDHDKRSLRIKNTQLSALLSYFMRVINQYEQAQTHYKERCTMRIKRQLQIMGASYSDEYVEKLIKQENLSAFSHGVLMETEHARQMLVDVEARHNDILKLEKSLRKLRELFIDMAGLVESQGEIIDKIDMHVSCTQNYVAKAHVNLTEAKTYNTNARKKTIIIVVFVLIVLSIPVSTILYFCFSRK